MAECLHSNQKYRDGNWVCRLCGVRVEHEPTDPRDYKTIGFSGIENFRQFRRLGKSEARMTEENIKAFRERKGYDPVPADDKGRWI